MASDSPQSGDRQSGARKHEESRAKVRVETPANDPHDPNERRGAAVSVSAATGASSVATDEASFDGESVVLDDIAIQRSLTRIAHEIVERHDDLDRLYLVAIPNGGVPLGRILQAKIASIAEVDVPLGILDTTLYRDDLSRGGVRPPLRKTEMPSSVDERNVMIVEDVVNTGRTIRAAMDAMMDFGRPTSVEVVALVDRGHRELPIKIDYVGKNIPTARVDKVKFRSKGCQNEGAGDSGKAELEPPYEVVVMTSSQAHTGGQGQ